MYSLLIRLEDTILFWNKTLKRYKTGTNKGTNKLIKLQHREKFPDSMTIELFRCTTETRFHRNGYTINAHHWTRAQNKVHSKETKRYVAIHMYTSLVCTQKLDQRHPPTRWVNSTSSTNTGIIWGQVEAQNCSNPQEQTGKGSTILILTIVNYQDKNTHITVWENSQLAAV